MIGAYTMQRLCNFVNVIHIDASEFEESMIPKSKHVLFIFVSQSGETKDVHHVLEIIKKNTFPTLSIVNVEDSLIARETTNVLYIKAGKEYGVASTKCCTLQIISMILFCLYIAKEKHKTISLQLYNEYINSLFQLSSNIEKILSRIKFKKEQLIHLLNKKTVVVLGKGLTYPIAKEGALKIKEISYIHAESFAAGSLKHGPLALINENVPVIILSNKENIERISHVYNEVIARGSSVVLIGHNNFNFKLKKTLVVEVPRNPHFDFLLSMIPLQYIAYHLSVKNNINPDFPRNLAKSVVVY